MTVYPYYAIITIQQGKTTSKIQQETEFLRGLIESEPHTRDFSHELGEHNRYRINFRTVGTTGIACGEIVRPNLIRQISMKQEFCDFSHGRFRT